MNSKKTIVLVVDVPGWAFDNVAQYVLSLLNDKYDAYIIYTSNFKTYEEFLEKINDYPKIDFIHFFYRGYLAELLNVIRCSNDPVIMKFLKAAVTTHIPDHLFISNENEILNNLHLFNFIDHYYTTSKKLYEIYKSIPYYPAPLQVIYDNILIPHVSSNIEERHQDLAVAWIGNSKWGSWKVGIHDYKGLQTVILPALELVEKTGIKIERYIVDKNDKLRSREDIIEILQRTDILLIASLGEGTPLTLIEAMSVGCAIITTNIGIAREVLPQIQQEFIINRDVRDFASAVSKLGRNRDLLATIKKQNTESYKKIFCDAKYFQNAWITLIESSTKRSHEAGRIGQKRQTFKTFQITKQHYSFFNLTRILKKIAAQKLLKSIVKSLLLYPPLRHILRPLFAVLKYIYLQDSCVNFKKLLAQYSELKYHDDKKSDDIYVIYSPLFQGVTHSTKQLFSQILPLPSLMLTEYLGLPDRVITQLAKTIIDAKMKRLIISGGGNMEVQLVEKLHKIKGDHKINIYLLWHGSPAQWVDSHHYEAFHKWLNLYKQGKVNAIITLKKDLEKVFIAYGIKSYLLQNFIPTQSQKLIQTVATNKFSIGMWSASSIWIKNLYPQLTAIGMLKDEVVCFTNFYFDKNDSWLKENIELKNFPGNLPREELMNLMANTDLTLYITNSECSPMIVLESLSVGVPCLVGPTSGIYDDDKYLRDMLTVNRVDCPFAIYEAITRVRDNIDKIKSCLPNFIKGYNEKAEFLRSSLFETIINN